jgi:RNA polymerase sigma factor (sigma-70 family)
MPVSDKDIEDRIVRAIRRHFLRYSEEVVEKYKNQIASAVRWYISTLPSHVQKSEGDDLESEAKIAFIDSLKNWDPRMGELWTYASIRVKGAMQDYLRKRGNDPVAGMFDYITQTAHVYLAFNKEHVQDHSDLEETIQVDKAMEGLNENEKVVIKEYFTADKTFKEIGKVINLSESQVSRICKTATTKIRDAMKGPAPESEGSPDKSEDITG